MVNHVGIQRAFARRLKPFEVIGHALGTVKSGVEEDVAALSATLYPQLVVLDRPVLLRDLLEKRIQPRRRW